MNLKKLEREVPFDQFSRQFQVTKIVDILRGDDTSLKILDVGGYKGRTADFLSADKVTVVDLFKVKEKNYIQGSALDLPFEDGSFDYVLSFDVLEHIPDDQRKVFLHECIRVAKKGIIICAPNKTELNQATELKLNELYKRLHHKPHRWLKEHIDYGIPRFDWVQQTATKRGLYTSKFYSNKTELWYAMQQAIFTNSKFPLASQNLTKLNEYYNQHFKYDGGGSEETAYRQILCGLKQKSDADFLSERLKNLNEPINALAEAELKEKIHEYYSVLLAKTTQLAKNYKELYEFHERAAILREEQNHSLRKKMQKYEKLKLLGSVTKVKFIPRRTT
jgi:ubiquinone/menaquinone biosynthesis C-methylase UbiE